MAAVRTPAPTGRRTPAVLRRLLAGRDAPVPAWRTRLTAGLAGAALTVTVLGGLLAGAQGAGPGDLLYGVKRGGEQTRLALAGDPDRGLTLLRYASTRLDEVSRLAAGPDAGLVPDTLGTMDRQTTQGTADLTSRAVERADPGLLGTLAGWAGRQRDGLAALTGAVPPAVRDELATSVRLVSDVAARGTALRAALACAGGPATAGSDELGPVPAPCAPAAPDAAPRPGGTGTAPGSSSPPSPAGPAAPVPGPDGAPPPAPADGGTAPGSPAPSAPSSGAPPLIEVPLPLPSLPGVPTTSPPASSAPPLIEVPLPLCVSALGIPVVC
jgi:Domain of unknown function (DUF5667)